MRNFMRIRLLVFFVLLFCAHARAATFTVTSTADPGDGVCDVAGTGDGCTMREAISAANSTPDLDEIYSDNNLSGTLELSSGPLTINTPMTIRLSVAAFTISGNDLSSIFYISGGTVSMFGLTIQRGKSSANGGAIVAAPGSTLTLRSCNIEDNSASSGGSSLGGGIYNSGTLNLINCTLLGNAANGVSGFGGGIYNNGSLSLTNCTLFGNTASGTIKGRGGAIYNAADGALTVKNCTISGNSAAGGANQAGGNRGGGIYSTPNTIFNLNNSIVVGNASPADTALADVDGTRTTNVKNLTSMSAVQAGLETDSNGVAVLKSNISYTPIIVILPNSPALNTGNTNEPYDQIGTSRPQSFAPDIGAFELRDPVQSMFSPVVNTIDDHNDGTCGMIDCTLREAISVVSQNGTIGFSSLFSIPQTITLTKGELKIAAKKFSINGPSARLVSISGNNATRIFTIDNYSTISLNGLTLTGGNGLSTLHNNSGGAIFVETGTLALNACFITGNKALGAGAGIYSILGDLLIEDSLITNNTVIYNGTNFGYGGGLYSYSESLSIFNSTISGNTVQNGIGAGLYQGYGTAAVRSSTITNNKANGANNGIRQATNDPEDTLTISNSIIASNNDGQSGRDIIATDDKIISEGFNLIGDPGMLTVFNQTGDKVGTTANPLSPQLGALANNGGPTDTHALLSGSPALDGGNPAYSGPLTTDQRGAGFLRVRGFAVDIGAYEVQNDPTIVSIAPGFSDTFSETAGNNATQLRMTRSGDITNPLRVNLRTSDVSEATVQPTADFAPGQAFIDVPLNAVDDTLRDGTQNVLVEVTAPGLVFQKVTVHVTDNDPAALSARLAPAAFAENKTGTAATLTIEHNHFNISRVVTVTLSSNDARLHLPATVDIPVGKRSVEVPVTVTPDAAIQGTINATITATATAFNKATVTATIYDAEAALTLSVKPGSAATISEGPNNTSTLLRLTRNTPTTNALIAALAIRRGDGQIILPATVTIPTGQSFVDFTVSSVDDGIADGTQSVAIQAFVTGYKSVSAQVFVIDNDQPIALSIQPSQ